MGTGSDKTGIIFFGDAFEGNIFAYLGTGFQVDSQLDNLAYLLGHYILGQTISRYSDSEYSAGHR